jgi:hypothetical protein
MFLNIMNQQVETKRCQNCKKDFTIESEDFNFYEKIKVPPPTFCPECRFQRRMTWRNERALYKRSCDLCHKDFISMYHKDSPFPVYCRECWYSDKWDATSFGRDYDFSKPFFEQWKELSQVVPRFGIFQRNAINSDYSNMVGECRNVYLSISVVLGSENIFYSWGVDKSFNIFDSYNVKESESCYENIECERNYNCQHLTLSHDCLDSFFLFDCVNCNNCALSSNLRNKEFYFRNKKLSKEEYFKEIERLNLKSRESRVRLSVEFDQLCKNAIHRYSNIYKSLNSTGNNIINAKNCFSGFFIYNVEDAKYCYRFINSKDSMDIDYAGKAELMYEYNTGALNDYNIKFSYCAMDNVQNAEYIETCVVSQNLFGCISVKNKNNVILNKVYSQKDFFDLREKIIKHMSETPFIDKKGRVYKYGEFFPIELSVFTYNESPANDFFPLSKEKIKENGYRWREPEIKNHLISIRSEEIPDSIEEVDEKILRETLECLHQEKCEHHCTKAFRLTKDELSFYKKWQIPISNKCYNCRHYERFKKVLPPKLWHRKCMKEGCENEFETSYAPERPEIVYCERCYQQEVY